MAGLTGGSIAIFGVAMGALLAIYGVTLPGAGEVWMAAGIGCAALTLFATRAVPEIVTAFGIFLAALALGIVPREIVFSGFMTGGFWLLVSGIILGAAITATGLAARISARLIGLTGPSYPRAILVIAAAGLALGVLIPSTMPRIIVMIPIAAALGDRLGLNPTGRGAIGLVATAATATLLPTYTILTANLPTIVQVGAMDQLYGVHSTYSGYLLQQWPVNLLRFVLLVGLMVGFSRDPVTAVAAPEVSIEPARPEQNRLLMVLGAAILFWMTDFIHGIPPAWVALSAATIVVWPRFGMLKPTAMREQIDLSPAIFFASIVAVVALAREVGLDQRLANIIIGALPFDRNGGLSSVYSVYGFSLVLSHLTTAPAAPAVLVPFAASLSDATGLSLEAISMTQIIGISTPLIPYQAPPLIVAMSISKVPNAVFLRLCLWLALAVTLVGVPLTYFWWKLIGVV
ncbi:SLC13 family permease [Rhodobacteraceae bacterium]|nr:SLC13 family permease [Paracoccaceae bacterium]